MKKQPKYLEVLKYLYEQYPLSVHYATLEPIIYSEEIRTQYRKSRGKKLVIEGMVCRYMGKLCRKDFCAAEYKHIPKGISYFVGYYIRKKGMDLLKENGIIN